MRKAAQLSGERAECGGWVTSLSPALCSPAVTVSAEARLCLWGALCPGHADLAGWKGWQLGDVSKQAGFFLVGGAASDCFCIILIYFHIDDCPKLVHYRIKKEAFPRDI